MRSQRDRLVKGKISTPGFLEQAPLSNTARRDILRLETDQIDYLPGLSSDEKKARRSQMSYRDYLLDVVKVDPSVIPLYQSRTHVQRLAEMRQFGGSRASSKNRAPAKRPLSYCYA